MQALHALATVAIVFAFYRYGVPAIGRLLKAINWNLAIKLIFAALLGFTILSAMFSSGGGGGCHSYARGPETGDC